jgi:hypothetical protein
MAPGALAREYALQSAPVIPFQNYSAAYVKHALATPINWTSLGAVTPVKDQGVHGYCGTFGRVGSCEGQLALKKGVLVSLAEEELIDCIGWDQDQVMKERGYLYADYLERLALDLCLPPVLVFRSEWLHAYVVIPLQHDWPGHGPAYSLEPVSL